MTSRQQNSKDRTSALNPSAEFAVQRAEDEIRKLRETGDTYYVGQAHYELAQAAEAQRSFIGLSEDDEMQVG